ncbi:MAG: sulfide/dihydroorotate dehydrogenase-like FAD/NAD-binding protein [Armatimonadota bacterium]|nr:sulfide/dihydroorotate dehydrogenase-like FAD/NAD-binding protein [Armatimonadota bacterium]
MASQKQSSQGLQWPADCKLANIEPEHLRNIIVRKERLAPTVTLVEVRAPLVARAAKPGQFVIVWPHEKSERIPLTISEHNTEAGTITLVFQEVGRTTIELGEMEVGDEIASVAGPLGTPTEIDFYGSVVVVAGGVGAAIALPVAKALKEAGNKLVFILGARQRSLVILEDRIREISDQLIITTDDGSYGRKGLVTEPLQELLAEEKIDFVFTAGPLPMMKAVAQVTKPYGIKTVASLDAIMIDGTGMCGGCRVTVGGKTLFTCVDGPDFDAHLVDWEELQARKAFYFEEERSQLSTLSDHQQLGGE